MVAGLILVPIVSLVTPSPEKKQVDEIFSCYDEEVEVRMKVALPDEEQEKA